MLVMCGAVVRKLMTVLLVLLGLLPSKEIRMRWYSHLLYCVLFIYYIILRRCNNRWYYVAFNEVFENNFYELESGNSGRKLSWAEFGLKYYPIIFVREMRITVNNYRDSWFSGRIQCICSRMHILHWRSLVQCYCVVMYVSCSIFRYQSRIHNL